MIYKIKRQNDDARGHDGVQGREGRLQDGRGDGVDRRQQDGDGPGIVKCQIFLCHAKYFPVTGQVHQEDARGQVGGPGQQVDRVAGRGGVEASKDVHY